MERRADPSTQLEIDQAILDYLVYSTIKALIRDYKATRHNDGGQVNGSTCVGTMLELVDSFVTLFRSIHPGKHATEEIQFRLRLLRFAALFSSRFTSVPIKLSSRSMKEPRAQGSKRHRVLEEAVDHSADLKDVGKANGSANTTARENTGNRDLTGSYQPTRSISLLETLPSFMGLSATQSALQALPVSDVWMRLAAGYMAHAALEQSLLHGTNLSDALKEAFQWRFDPESAAEEGTDEWAINTMFFDENGEVDGWSDIKNEHIRTVLPPGGVSLRAHADILLAHELPMGTFEESLMCFIEGLLDAHPKPLYAQLELGKVDGLSRPEPS